MKTAETVLGISTLLFCSVVLFITPWPSAGELFNPYTTQTQANVDR